MYFMMNTRDKKKYVFCNNKILGVNKMGFEAITDAVNALIQNSWLDCKNIAPLFMIVILCEISHKFGVSIIFKLIMRVITTILEFWFLIVTIMYFWSVISRVILIILIIIVVLYKIINTYNNKKLDNKND